MNSEKSREVDIYISSLGDLGEPLLDCLFGAAALELVDDLSVLEGNHVRDAADLDLSTEIWHLELLAVNVVEDDLATEGCHLLLHYGVQRLAGWAPGGGALHDHDSVARQNGLPVAV